MTSSTSSLHRWFPLLITVVGGLGAAWFAFHPAAPHRAAYSPRGLGGPAPQAPARPSPPARDAGAAVAAPASAPARALGAYNRGRFGDAAAAAEAVLGTPASRRPPTPSPRVRAEARWVLAFSRARQHRFAAARREFAALRTEAQGQPWLIPGADAKPPPAPSTSVSPPDPTPRTEPTLEEEAAYQHAVLTAALAGVSRKPLHDPHRPAVSHAPSPPPTPLPGERSPTVAEAEAEFLAFLRTYPLSPLVHAATHRLRRFRDGNLSTEAEAAWKAAMAQQAQAQAARQKERAECVPDVLLEVLRRTGQPLPSGPDPGETLARELGTNAQGTPLLALVQAGRRRGFRVEGLELTWDGLLAEANRADEARPVQRAVLLQPGHLVLLESANRAGVEVWDPSAGGAKVAGQRRFTPKTWGQHWAGVLLRLEPGAESGPPALQVGGTR